MPRDLVPTREGPKEEISIELIAGKRVFAATETRKQNKADAAAEARKLSSEQAHKRDFEKAKQHLTTLQYATAIAMMEELPIGVLEMYLLAEEATQNREIILRMFPKPGAKARERYLLKQKRPKKLVTASA